MAYANALGIPISPNELAAYIASLINQSPLAGDFSTFASGTGVFVQAQPSPHYNDTFNIGVGPNTPLSQGSLAGIDSPLTIGLLSPPPGVGTPPFVVTANIYDTDDSGSQTFTLTGASASAPGLLTGSAMGPNGSIAYESTVTNLNIYLGSGKNTFNVQSTSATALTTLYDGTGNDTTVNVGSLAPLTGGDLAGIQGALVVVGAGDDTMNVDDTGSSGQSTGTLTSSTLNGLGMGPGGITYTGLGTLNISLGSGPNTFNIQSTYSATITTLNDLVSALPNTINIGSLAPQTGGIVNLIQGALTVNADGHDTMNVDDTGSSMANTGTLTNTTLTGLGMGPAGITYHGLSVMNIFLGNGVNTFNITSTNGPTLYTVVTNDGAAGQTQNTINIGRSSPNLGGIVDNIQGPIVLVGDGHDMLNVIDNGSAGPKSAVLTNSTLAGMGMVTAPIVSNGATYSGINYSGLSLLNVYLGSGGNTFTVDSTWPTTHTNINLQKNTAGDPTTITTLSGVDYINIGSIAPVLGGIVDYIQGPVVVAGDGLDIMNVDDSGNPLGKRGTLTSSTLTGLNMGPAGISYSGLTLLNVFLSSGGNNFTVVSTNPATTTNISLRQNAASTKIITLSGADNVNIGTLEPYSGGVVDAIQAPVSVVGDGLTTLNVDDTGSTSNKTGTLTNNTLTGLNMAPAGIAYSDLAALNISLGSGNNTFNILSTYYSTVTTLGDGMGNDTINIQATSGPTNIVTQAGSDVVNIGSLAPALENGIAAYIQGAIAVTGGGHDTLNVDDTGDCGQSNGTLTSTTLTGLSMGPGGITYSGLALLNVSLGQGQDTFTVASTNPATVTNVNLQRTQGPATITTLSGTNFVNIGSNAPGTGGILDNLRGPINVIGDGATTLNVDDTGSAAADQGTLTYNQLTGLNMDGLVICTEASPP